MNSAIAKAKNILSTFPKETFNYCFCYGSGVFKQTGKSVSNPMIDMVLVVNNSLDFHESNMCKHRWHYSALKYLGASSVTRFQEQWGARIYYNTLIYHAEQNVTFKYGVISRDDFVTDLLDWCYLYMSGRLHKPVAVIHESKDNELLTALRINLFSAIHVALLVLPENFSEIEFYQTIANISYLGDFRMWFGEDKNKINNIVLPQIDYFRELYSNIILSLNEFLYIPENNIGRNCQQNISPEARWHHLNNLPRVPQKELVKYVNKLGGLRRDTEEVLQSMSYDPDIGEILCNCLKKTVLKSSLRQSLKGVATAGFVKSIRYSGRKVYKSLISLRH